jgi:hypothetical protein
LPGVAERTTETFGQDSWSLDQNLNLSHFKYEREVKSIHLTNTFSGVCFQIGRLRMKDHLRNFITINNLIMEIEYSSNKQQRSP